ncbi:hypothetical protein N0V90_002559 [Kalmusia sp. IMI 367209]|nr:hypothetical protein N0V90_002559 [Kalmusia sp. IMI 367209]
MNRKDSAFDETFRLEANDNKLHKIRRSKTASSRHWKSRQPLPVVDPNLNDQTSTMSTIRPSSEKPIPTQRRSAEPRRKSITTTSSNSAKSRRPGHGSAPSSRRTSCTLIDPSRPTRHYRINSSQTCPTLNRDIDDVLALHFRSCTLFQNTPYQPSLPSPTMSAYGSSVPPAEIGASPGPLHPSVHESDSPPLDEKARAAADVEDTTMHWMSPSTRKTQYEKIDRANSGLGGSSTALRAQVRVRLETAEVLRGGKE